MSSDDLLIRQANALLAKATHGVALTGAGISTPSGLPEFRSASSGLWESVDPMEVASIYAFERSPKSFYEWVRPLAELVLQAEPNAAHIALAQLEMHGPLECVVTQNIDMLHTKAGSEVVYELHGHLREATCLRCYQISDAETLLTDFVVSGRIPHCSHCGGILKPNVILFGELLPVGVLSEAKRQIRACDLMLVAGSSLVVSPAGDLPLLAREVGAKLIIVNLSETPLDDEADVVIHADVAEVLPQLAAPFL